MTYVIRPSIIDVEASGFGPNSYPIEIGVALSTGERYSTLILPASAWTYWDLEAQRLHQVTMDTLLENGKPIHEAATILNKLLENKILYSDGWVVDKPWVDRLFYAAGMIQRFSLSPIETILSESQMNRWHETKNQVLKEFGFKRHRASTDALIIQETYVRTRKGGPS